MERDISGDNKALCKKADFLPPAPDFAAEHYLLSQGARAVCGVDEVGRGPLAGPVVAAAVILDSENLPQGLQDSKKLSAGRRSALSADILARALAVSYASLPAKFIDDCNIRAASLTAMRMAVHALALPPDYALIDGRDIPPDLRCPAFPLIKGDARALSIAAAAILAKTMRDSMMEYAGELYPAYGFERHSGYGTALHKEALAEQGIIKDLHRVSFAPVKALIKYQ